MPTDAVSALDECVRKEIKSTRNPEVSVPGQPRIAVVDGGLHHREAFQSFEHKQMKSLRSLSRIALELFDIVVVPFHTDQLALAEVRGRLQAFVRRGGILVIFGATQESGQNWIPFSQWTAPYTKSVEPNFGTNDADRIFRGLSPGQLQYHGIYWAHGSLHPTVPHQVLATGDDSRIVMFSSEVGKGSVLVTTLDPDFHSVSWVPGPTPETTEETHANASHLLRNVMEWAVSKWSEQTVSFRLTRRAAGLLGEALLIAVLLSWFALPAAVLTVIQIAALDEGAQDPLRLLLTFLSSLALVGSLLAVWRQYRKWLAAER